MTAGPQNPMYYLINQNLNNMCSDKYGKHSG